MECYSKKYFFFFKKEHFQLDNNAYIKEFRLRMGIEKLKSAT